MKYVTYELTGYIAVPEHIADDLLDTSRFIEDETMKGNVTFEFVKQGNTSLDVSSVEGKLSSSLEHWLSLETPEAIASKIVKDKAFSKLDLLRLADKLKELTE